MIVVTSAARYIDVDAFACCVAYAELLNLLGKPSLAASTAIWNESITKSLRSLNVPLITDHQTTPNDQFVVVDVSDETQFDKLVVSSQIIEVIDHHPGQDDYWTRRIGGGAEIEFVGAAATLIYERWLKAGVVSKMCQASAKLLATAILDNTLNFEAQVTTARDKQAYKVLADLADLDSSWPRQYFKDCQDSIMADLAVSLRNDTKFLSFSGLSDELCFGQIVVWEGQSVIKDHLRVIQSVLGSMSQNWLANVVSISEDSSYFISGNNQVKTWAEQLLNIKFDDHMAKANRLWLRKEVMKQGLKD